MEEGQIRAQLRRVARRCTGRHSPLDCQRMEALNRRLCDMLPDDSQRRLTFDRDYPCYWHHVNIDTV